MFVAHKSSRCAKMAMWVGRLERDANTADVRVLHWQTPGPDSSFDTIGEFAEWAAWKFCPHGAEIYTRYDVLQVNAPQPHWQKVRKSSSFNDLLAQGDVIVAPRCKDHEQDQFYVKRTCEPL